MLITDAPCHGTDYHTLGEKRDNFHKGDKNGRIVED